jgi:hypothetical protein
MSDVWYMLSEHEKYVYHYTRAEILTEYILPNRTLKFSTFRDLNDPRETKNFDLDGYAAAAIGGDYPTVKAEMERALKTGWKIACFVADPAEAVISAKTDALGPRQLEAMHERGHSRPRMWAQYADCHRGACLVFRKRRLDEAIRSHARHAGFQVFCGAVTYRNVPVVGSFGPGPFSFSTDGVRRHGIAVTAEHHVKQHFAALYLAKNRDWEAENEFRWLLRGSDDQEAYVDFGDALVGNSIGEAFPEALKPAVGRFALRNDISVTVMDWRRGIPQPKPTTPRALLPEGDPDRPLSGW